MKIKKARTIIGSEFSFSNLRSFDRPKFADKLTFPNDITQLTAQNVSELIGKYTKLLCYVQEQHSKLTVDVLRVEMRIQQTESTIFLESPAIAHIERWKRDQKVASDGRMMGLKLRLTELKAHKEISWSFMQNYERCIAALSRELTRKTASGDGFRFAKHGV